MSIFIKDFQYQQGLTPDGILGRNTAKKMMEVWGIKSTAQMAHFLGNTHHETGGFKVAEENLNYSADRIVQIWPTRFKSTDAATPYHRNPKGLATVVYGGRMGNTQPLDGWNFRGRGALQLTGRKNYERFEGWLRVNGLLKSVSHDIIENPALVVTTYFWETALFYFTVNKLWGKALNVGIENIRIVRKAVNGGYIGIEDVTAKVNYYYKMLNQ